MVSLNLNFVQKEAHKASKLKFPHKHSLTNQRRYLKRTRERERGGEERGRERM